MSPINPQNVENPEAHIMQEPLSKAYVYVCVCEREKVSYRDSERVKLRYRDNLKGTQAWIVERSVNTGQQWSGDNVWTQSKPTIPSMRRHQVFPPHPQPMYIY